MKNEFICISTNEGEKLKVGQSYTYPAWQLFFSDSYTRVKVGNGEQYFKIEDNRVVLADTATNWDLVKCEQNKSEENVHDLPLEICKLCFHLRLFPRSCQAKSLFEVVRLSCGLFLVLYIIHKKHLNWAI